MAIRIYGGDPARCVALGKNEVSVLRELMRGLSNKEIAFEVGTTAAMVGKMLHEIGRRIDCKTRLEMLIWCLQRPDELASDLDPVIVDRDRHPEGCRCNRLYCTAMRLALEAIPGELAA